MKRIFLLALVLIPFNLFAQLEATDVYSRIEVARASRFFQNKGPVKVHYDGSYSLSGATTNEFDIFFVLNLGDTKEEAVRELRSLAKLCEKNVGLTIILKELDINTIICTVSDWTHKRSAKSSKSDRPGSMLFLHKNGYLGEFQITKTQLESLAKQVEKFEEE